MAAEITATMIQTHGSSVAVTATLSPHEVSGINIEKLAPTPETHASIHLQSVSLLDPTCITSKFDELRFEAAAHDQLIIRKELPPQSSGSTSKQLTTIREMSETASDHAQSSFTLLISSPYNIPGHYLDIASPHLTTSSRLLALALTALKPATPAYATAPYTQALNFDSVLSVLRDLTNREDFVWKETSFYVVTFRSQLKENIDEECLYKLDAESHREACESGGLLKYWFGKADEEKRNLATCFWHSREDAYRGGLGPWHRKARAAGREMYESIIFSTYRFTVTDGVEGYAFEEWVR